MRAATVIALHEFFPRCRTLFETPRGGMQGPRQIRRGHAGRRAKTEQRRIRDGAGQRRFESALVMSERRARQRGARAHQIGCIRSQRAHEAARPGVAGSDDSEFQAVPRNGQGGDGRVQLTAERVLERLAEQLFLIGELQVQSLPRHPGGAGHFLHRGLTKAVASKHSDGGIQQRRLARVCGVQCRGRDYVHPHTIDKIGPYCQSRRNAEFVARNIMS